MFSFVEFTELELYYQKSRLEGAPVTDRQSLEVLPPRSGNAQPVMILISARGFLVERVKIQTVT